MIEQIVPLSLYPNRHAPTFAEFKRVSHQVHETLGDSPSVPEGERNIILGRGSESQSLFQGQRLKRGADGFHHVLHGILAQNQLHAPGFNLGKIQNIIYQIEQMLAIRLDIYKRLP